MFKNLLFLLGIGMIWGSQFLFQQMAVADLPAVWVGAGRALVGCLTLLLVCRLLNIKSEKNNWKMYHLVGFLEATLPFVLVAWGQQYMDTAVAAILMGTIPFFTILLAPLLVAGARITLTGITSVIVGFAGLLLLFYPQLITGSSNGSLAGALAIIGASGSFAIALLMLKRIEGSHPLMVARNVLLAASSQLLIIASIMVPPTTLSPSADSLTAVVYLGLMCAGVVYFLYMVLIQRAGPVFASFSNYLVPLFGVLLGATINNEILPGTTWIALTVILSAVAINQFFSSKLGHAKT
ncbi:EamA family transporter [Kistimonas scapharcae]|uniref:EamA family transporter n=1 Tax=Kistimonas scapharcae TaxID=1036133 RepID=A0ABP8V3I9_9GAMM